MGASVTEPTEKIYWRDPVSHQWFSALKTGKCDYEKCKSACCRVFLLQKCTAPEKEHYWTATGRGVMVNIDGYHYAASLQKCKQLDEETGKCRIYSSRPTACRMWPIPGDELHALLKDVCTISITNIQQVPKYKVPKEYKDA